MPHNITMCLARNYIGDVVCTFFDTYGGIWTGRNAQTNLCHIPKPVLEKLGSPPRLTFIFADDGQIVVRHGTRREVVVLSL